MKPTIRIEACLVAAHGKIQRLVQLERVQVGFDVLKSHGIFVLNAIVDHLAIKVELETAHRNQAVQIVRVECWTQYDRLFGTARDGHCSAADCVWQR